MSLPLRSDAEAERAARPGPQSAHGADIAVNGHLPPARREFEWREGQAVVLRADGITPTTLEWIWPGRLAQGALTNLVGLPDEGKSLLFVDIAARISTGSPMPPAPRHPATQPPGRVCILTGEDQLASTVVPRLMAAEADLSRIDLLTGGTWAPFNLEKDLGALEQALRRGPEPYRLLVVDGLMSYLGKAKTHVDADVRRVLGPVVGLLEQLRLCALSVMHPPKTLGRSLQYYAAGSVAFSGLPRVTLGVARDPGDEHPNPRRLLVKLKGNLYGVVPSLAYRIVAERPDAVPRLAWDPDPVTVDVRDLFDPPQESAEDRSIRKDCAAWLRAYLADGPKPSTAVEAAALAAGFKGRTVDRARAEVCRARKIRRIWMLELRTP